MEAEEITCTNCGLVNDYRTENAGPHIKAICNGCDQYLKMLAQGPMTLYFGKYKGRTVDSLTAKEELGWLQWCLRNVNTLKPKQVEKFTQHLAKHNMGV